MPSRPGERVQIVADRGGDYRERRFYRQGAVKRKLSRPESNVLACIGRRIVGWRNKEHMPLATAIPQNTGQLIGT